MKIRNLTLCIALFSLFAIGCGDDSTPAGDVSDARQVQEVDAAVDGTCNFTNCDGCCDGNVCIEPVTEAACGQAGSACRSCENDEVCAGGSCVPPTANCDNCAGCCLDGTQCLEGSAPAACGDSGNACVACETGESCDNGTCVANECNAENCSGGCCDASGQCQTFPQQSEESCGRAGQACNSCPTDTISCTLGTCVVDQPCLDFCDEGCCTPQGQCVLFGEQDAMTCGAAETCSACGNDLSCVGGECTNDPVWTISIRNVIIPPKDENGSDWDTVIFSSPLPDPFVQSGLDSNSVSFPEGETDVVDDTVTPNWSIAEQTTYSHTESSLLGNGLRFRIRDSDGVGFFETIGECNTTVSMAELMAGTKTLATCGLATNLKIDFVQQ